MHTLTQIEANFKILFSYIYIYIYFFFFFFFLRISCLPDNHPVHVSSSPGKLHTPDEFHFLVAETYLNGQDTSSEDQYKRKYALHDTHYT